MEEKQNYISPDCKETCIKIQGGVLSASTQDLSEENDDIFPEQ